MGRPQKFPPPRFLTVVTGADEPAEAVDRRGHILRAMAYEPTRGRRVRIDRLREAITIADQVPPTPQDQWRRFRGRPGMAITPRREQLAAARLIDICAARGDELSVANATRIIEQGRKILDETRGISRENRKIIEAARDIIDDLCEGVGPAGQITVREYAAVAKAMEVIRSALGCAGHDREFCVRAEGVIARGLVH